MNKNISCKLLNIEFNELEQYYTIKKNANLSNTNYKIIFTLINNNELDIICVQFKLYTLLIESIELIESNKKNQIRKITNINPDGFLISFDFKNNNKIEIKFNPTNNNGKIFIKNTIINNYKQINLNKIYWDNIFIINLKRRYDRKINIINKFNSYNIDKYEFIEGIDGMDLEIKEKFNYLKQNNKTKIITSGHFACLLSHIKAIELAKSRGYTNIMILEDDVNLCHNFINIIKNINIPSYDMIYLGGIIDKKKIFFNHWAKTNGILGAYAYILTSNLFDKILEELNKLIDYVDLFYMKNIQLNYRVILLDDLVKTNLDSSDTSNKKSLMIQRLSYIK